MLCYAPFKTMQFKMRGKVVASCHNSKEPNGEYLAQTIKEIWNSQQVKNTCSRMQDSPTSSITWMLMPKSLSKTKEIRPVVNQGFSSVEVNMIGVCF